MIYLSKITNAISSKYTLILVEERKKSGNRNLWYGPSYCKHNDFAVIGK